MELEIKIPLTEKQQSEIEEAAHDISMLLDEHVMKDAKRISRGHELSKAKVACEIYRQLAKTCEDDANDLDIEG